jgi:hypothetical protein
MGMCFGVNGASSWLHRGFSVQVRKGERMNPALSSVRTVLTFGCFGSDGTGNLDAIEFEA